MSKIRKGLSRLLAAGLLLTSLTACDDSSSSALKEKAKQQNQEEIKATLELKLDKELRSIQGLAQYSIPVVEIQSKKSNFSLDPFTHLGNALKAQEITFPVSEEYFNSVRVGDELSSKFNWTGLLFDGEIGTYKNTIHSKSRVILNCEIINGNCHEIDSGHFADLLKIGEAKYFSEIKRGNPNLYLKEGDTNIDFSEITDTCTVGITTSKQITL